MGAWFEVRLFGWLGAFGETFPSPEFAGRRPDFDVRAGGTRFLVEARAVVKDPETRERQRRERDVTYALQQIDLPYVVIVNELTMGHDFPLQELESEARAWLEHHPSQKFIMEKGDNRVIMTAEPRPNGSRVGVVLGPGEFRTVSGEPLKRPLRQKAVQHAAAKEAGLPLVVAVFLESHELSADEVVEAWLGRVVYKVDWQKGQAVAQGSDLSGIHFFRGAIRHTTVTGTLVFKSEGLDSSGSINLVASYVQNPFAANKVDPMIFPATRRFVVAEETAESYRMAWEHTAQ